MQRIKLSQKYIALSIKINTAANILTVFPLVSHKQVGPLFSNERIKFKSPHLRPSLALSFSSRCKRDEYIRGANMLPFVWHGNHQSTKNSQRCPVLTVNFNKSIFKIIHITARRTFSFKENMNDLMPPKIHYFHALQQNKYFTNNELPSLCLSIPFHLQFQTV